MRWIERNIGSIAPIIIVIAFLAPFIITDSRYISERFDGTGEIGDTIGGLSTPFLNLLGIILLYITLREQINSLNLQRISLETQQKELINQEESSRNERSFVIMSGQIKQLKIEINNVRIVKWDKEVITGISAFYEVMEKLHEDNDFIRKFLSNSSQTFFVRYYFILNDVTRILRNNFNSKLEQSVKETIYEDLDNIRTLLILVAEGALEYDKRQKKPYDIEPLLIKEKFNIRKEFESLKPIL